VREALGVLHEAAREDVPAQLSVGEDADARPRLERDRLVDGAILDRLEVGRRELPGLTAAPGVQQGWRTQQRADVLCPDGVHRSRPERTRPISVMSRSRRRGGLSCLRARGSE
jgi:hypothetical protein